MLHVAPLPLKVKVILTFVEKTPFFGALGKVKTSKK
jgi:hypothetical protein